MLLFHCNFQSQCYLKQYKAWQIPVFGQPMATDVPPVALRAFRLGAARWLGCVRAFWCGTGKSAGPAVPARCRAFQTINDTEHEAYKRSD